METAASKIPLESLAFQTDETFAADAQKYRIDLRTLKYVAEAAFQAKSRAHCRYSKFRVGAAILTSSAISADCVATKAESTSSPDELACGVSSDQTAVSGKPQIVIGANMENASSPVGTCAERVAFGTALTLGHPVGSFRAVAVSADTTSPCSPCGMCRQFIREFCTADMPVFMFNVEGKHTVLTVGELLPLSFGPDDLKAGQRAQ